MNIKIKNRTKSRRLLFLSAAVICSIAIGGCGKKHEKIDLEQQTDAAEATMAPATEATLPSSSSPISPTKPAETTSAASSQTGTRPGAVTYTTDTYTSGKVSIQYPVMEQLEEAQAPVNDLIRANALAAADAYVKDPQTDSFNVTCQVLGANKSRITIVYTGSSMSAGAPYPVNLLYSSTIDVRNAANLDLPQMTDPRLLADYVMSPDCVYSSAFGGTEDGQTEALRQVHAERSASWYESLFSAADFPADGSFPACFSFEKDGDIYVSIPVPHALGDYAVAVFTPENK